MTHRLLRNGTARGHGLARTEPTRKSKISLSGINLPVQHGEKMITDNEKMVSGNNTKLYGNKL
jgi:hypothetical protein